MQESSDFPLLQIGNEGGGENKWAEKNFYGLMALEM